MGPQTPSSPGLPPRSMEHNNNPNNHHGGAALGSDDIRAARRDYAGAGWRLRRKAAEAAASAAEESRARAALEEAVAINSLNADALERARVARDRAALVAVRCAYGAGREARRCVGCRELLARKADDGSEWRACGVCDAKGCGCSESVDILRDLCGDVGCPRRVVCVECAIGDWAEGDGEIELVERIACQGHAEAGSPLNVVAVRCGFTLGEAEEEAETEAKERSLRLAAAGPDGETSIITASGESRQSQRRVLHNAPEARVRKGTFFCGECARTALVACSCGHQRVCCRCRESCPVSASRAERLKRQESEKVGSVWGGEPGDAVERRSARLRQRTN